MNIKLGTKNNSVTILLVSLIILILIFISFQIYIVLIIPLIILLMFLLSNEKKILYLFLILIPLDSFLMISRITSKYIKFSFIVLLLVLLIFFIVKYKKIYRTNLNLVVLLFISMLIINTIFSRNIEISLIPNITVIGCSLLAFVGFYFVNKNNLEKVLRILILSSIFVSLWGILQYLSDFSGIFISNEIKNRWSEFDIVGGDTLSDEYKRISSTFYSPNTLGVYLNSIILLNIILLLKKNFTSIITRKLLISSLLINIVAIFLTFSRTSWFSLILVIFLVILIIYKEKIILIFSFLILLFGLALIVIPTEFWITKLRISDGLGLRYYLWLNGWLIFKDYPIFGVGQGLFKEMYNNYYYIQSSHPFEHPHNMLLFILSEFGLIGIILFSLSISFMVWKIWVYYSNANVKSIESSYLLATVSIIILHLGSGLANKGTIIGWSSVTFLFWIIVGIAFRIGFEKNGENKKT